MRPGPCSVCYRVQGLQALHHLDHHPRRWTSALPHAGHVQETCNSLAIDSVKTSGTIRRLHSGHSRFLPIIVLKCENVSIFHGWDTISQGILTLPAYSVEVDTFSLGCAFWGSGKTGGPTSLNSSSMAVALHARASSSSDISDRSRTPGVTT